MNVSKPVRVAILTLMAGVLAACGEAPTSPSAEQQAGLRPPSDLTASAGQSFSLLGLLGTSQTSITVDPTVTRWYAVGEHWVYIPAGAVCRLDSSYGIGEWEKDCVSATERITIPVTVGTRNGHALVEFGIHLRFKPTSHPLKAAYLYLREPHLDPNPNRYAVLWQAPDGSWVNEAEADKSLRAFRVANTWVVRRVKHFSGYNVTLGYHEEQSDPTVRGEGEAEAAY